MKKRFLVALTVVLVARPFQGRAGGPEKPAPPYPGTCRDRGVIEGPGVGIRVRLEPSVERFVDLRHRLQEQRPHLIGAEIKFTLLLPNEWNGKFFMGGGGGFVGTVQNSAQSTVNLGYATAGTDTGHQGGAVEAGWALNNIERRVNFGYLAVHRTADVAKSIVLSYYGSASTRSYFSGCSRGGGQAMMEALRYPDDFDGVVAGAPAMDWTGIGAQFIKDAQAAFPAGASAPLVTPDVLKSIDAQIMAACDALDGVKDGTMEDPRRCTLSVDKMTGLTDAQRIALKKIYSETRARDGVLFPGQPYGGEGELQGWPAWITGAPLPGQTAPSLRVGFGTELFKYFVLVPVRELQEGHRADRQLSQLERSETRRVQGEKSQSDHVARLGGRGSLAARHDRVLRAGRGARSERARLLPPVHAARRAALRRRSRPRHR
ncbi:MAG: hypothetical protein DMG00_16040 [Acidobacteria bacterium]|nr:MAG: hypothetical protein DMG00_16040 [Acidobacteriota bacterium]